MPSGRGRSGAAWSRARCHDFLDLRRQAPLSLTFQRPPELLPAVTRLGLRILERRIEINPLQVGI